MASGATKSHIVQQLPGLFSIKKAAEVLLTTSTEHRTLTTHTPHSPTHLANSPTLTHKKQ